MVPSRLCHTSSSTGLISELTFMKNVQALSSDQNALLVFHADFLALPLLLTEPFCEKMIPTSREMSAK